MGLRGGLETRSAQLGQQVEGRWDDGRLLLPLGAAFQADQAWVGVLRFGRLLAVERVTRGQTRLHLVAPGLEPGADLGRLEVRAQEDESPVYLVGTDVLDASTGDLVTRLDSSWTDPVMAGPVPAGRYDLVLVGLTGFRQVVPDVQVTVGSEPTVVEVPLARPAALALTVTDPAGRPAEGLALVHDGAGRALARRSLVGGVVRFARLVPGTHRVTLLTPSARAAFDLALEPDGAVAQELRLEPAAALTLECRLPGALVMARDAEGRSLVETLMAAGDTTTVALGDGAYEVTVAGQDGALDRHAVSLSGEAARLVLR